MSNFSGNALMTPSGTDLQQNAMMMKEKAAIEARFIMAERHPRNPVDAEQRILQLCRNVDFARAAEYSKPISDKTVHGPSIRFIETILPIWKNIGVDQIVLEDTDKKRLISVNVTDYEGNVTFSKQVLIEKSVERRSGKNRKVLGTRLNTYGQQVSIVEATEDEFLTKEARLCSIHIRNNAARVIPSHVMEGAMKMVRQTIKEALKADPDSERKRLLVDLASKNIFPADIQAKFGVDVAQLTADDLIELRSVFNAISEGSMTWNEFRSTESEESEDSGSTGEQSRENKPTETRAQQLKERIKKPQQTQATNRPTTNKPTTKEPPKEEAISGDPNKLQPEEIDEYVKDMVQIAPELKYSGNQAVDQVIKCFRECRSSNELQAAMREKLKAFKNQSEQTVIVNAFNSMQSILGKVK